MSFDDQPEAPLEVVHVAHTDGFSDQCQRRRKSGSPAHLILLANSNRVKICDLWDGIESLGNLWLTYGLPLVRSFAGACHQLHEFASSITFGAF